MNNLRYADHTLHIEECKAVHRNYEEVLKSYWPNLEGDDVKP